MVTSESNDYMTDDIMMKTGPHLAKFRMIMSQQPVVQFSLCLDPVVMSDNFKCFFLPTCQRCTVIWFDAWVLG